MSDTAATQLPDALRAALAELDEPPPLPNAFEPLLERAALVGEFDLDWLEARADGSAEAKSAVLNRAEPVDGALDRWRLHAGVREAVLTALCLDRERLASRIAEVPPRGDSAGRALRLLLRRETGEAWDEEEPPLEALFEASSWLRGIPGISAPDPRALRRALTRKRLERSLAELAERFVGRNDQLDRLRLFASKPARADGRIPVLPLYGIGGIGKTALIARLLHLHFTTGTTRGPLLFHLDFDRFGAVNASPLELMFELTRQLAFHLPEMAEALDQRRKEAQLVLAGALPREAADRPTKSRPHAAEAASFISEDLSLGLEDLLGIPGREGRTLLMIFDTVEALQGASAEGLHRLAGWIGELRNKIGWPDIRVVLSGRVEPMLPGDPFVRVKEIELDELRPNEAVKLLVRLAVAKEAAEATVAELGGNPLILRLVAQLGARDALSPADLTGASDGRAAIDKELVQGVLYRRILGHVRDERVRRLAHPGLAARRVTADLIRHVIAPACLEEPVSGPEANRLYDALRSEVWLVEPAPDGVGVLHRSDLRKLTMKLIARDPVEAERVREVHRLAIAYYDGAGADEPHAPAEATYHRFMIPGGAMLPILDKAMATAARDAIGANIDELPPENRVALRAALGEAVSDAEAEQLPDYLWLRYAAKRGEELAGRDAFAEALRLAGGRAIPHNDPPWPWRIAALDALARWDELFDLLSDEFGDWQALRSLRPERDEFGRLLTWVAAGLKTGRLPPVPNITEQEEMLEVLTKLGPDPAGMTLRQYLVRAGWRDPSGYKLATSDLLRSPELAQEMMRYLQAAEIGQPYRPVRTQFFPDPDWLESLCRVAGPMASKPLGKLVIELRSTAPERLVMGRYLGHLSAQFEDAWTDAFVRQAIPAEALQQMIVFRDLAEFRTAARVAVLTAFAEPEQLQDLALGFASELPVRPFDLTPPGMRRALSNPREFGTNLIAFVDRCQLLYRFLGFAAASARDPRPIEAVRLGMRRWFTPAEAHLLADSSGRRNGVGAS